MSVEYETQIELQQKLEKAILTLNKKYAFDRKVVWNLAKDISEALFTETEECVREETAKKSNVIANPSPSRSLPLSEAKGSGSRVNFVKQSDEDDFDAVLQKVAEIIEKFINDANPAANFQTLKAQVKLLAAKTEGQHFLRRQMTALLATATRRMDSSELNKEQLRVLQEIVKRLKGTISNFEEIMECKRFLEQVGINVRPNLGYGAEVWARLVKDEDFL